MFDLFLLVIDKNWVVLYIQTKRYKKSLGNWMKKNKREKIWFPPGFWLDSFLKIQLLLDMARIIKKTLHRQISRLSSYFHKWLKFEKVNQKKFHKAKICFRFSNRCHRNSIFPSLILVSVIKNDADWQEVYDEPFRSRSKLVNILKYLKKNVTSNEQEETNIKSNLIKRRSK